MEADVVAVHAVERPACASSYVPWAFGPSLEALDEQWREWVDRVRHQLIDTWSRPLRDAGVDYRPVVIEGGAYDLLSNDRKVEGDFLVVGRQGLGSFRELLLGSSSRVPRSTQGRVARQSSAMASTASPKRGASLGSPKIRIVR